LTVSTKLERAKVITTTPSYVIATIPCYNEEKFISEVVRRVKKYVDMVIVVDDGSHDNTSLAAKAAGALVITHKSHNS